MHQLRSELVALVLALLCLALFGVSVSIAPTPRSAFPWLVPLFCALATLAWAATWYARRRARLAAAQATPTGTPPPTSPDASAAL